MRILSIQALECRRLLAANPVSAMAGFDVNLDGLISDDDARIVIEALVINENRSSESREPAPLSLDVNGDGRLSALDLLRVINMIERQPDSGSAFYVDPYSLGEGEGPLLSIADAQVNEGHAGATLLSFDVSLSEASTAAVSVDVSVSDGSATAFGVERIASGLSLPVYATDAPGLPNLLFIVEQSGDIEVLNLDTKLINSNPLITVPNVWGVGERGLLGMAFHPDYATNRLFYVYKTAVNGSTSSVLEYQADAGGVSADPGTERTILEIAQPFGNHNGGWIDFGPDGYLYIGPGDGGSGNDPRQYAQDITDSLLGKILRIDVNRDDLPADTNRNYAIPPDNPFVDATGDDEIWAFGLRNPWRSSFDRETGDLYIADVGQNAREEINFQAADSVGGENYGWRSREGTMDNASVPDAIPPGAIDPIYEYGHNSLPTGGYSVTGGYVYRGPVAELHGNYFFADYVSSRVWSIRFNGDDASDFDGTNYADFTDWTDLLNPDVGFINSISSFGEDAEGNLYILDRGGEIFWISDGGDYLPTMVTVSFPAGETSRTFEVEILGDRLPETSETVVATISNPTNADIADAQAIGTIVNDDAPQVKSVVVSGGAQRSIVDEVVLTFDSNVTFDETTGDAFVFRNVGSNLVADHTKTVSQSDGKTEVTFHFVVGATVEPRGGLFPTLVNGDYELNAVSSRISVGGLQLDGDSDGTAGGDHLFVDDFYRKFGDVNGNGVVDLLDFASLRGTFGKTSGDANYLGSFDGDGDNQIGLLDFAQFRQNFGT